MVAGLAVVVLVAGGLLVHRAASENGTATTTSAQTSLTRTATGTTTSPSPTSIPSEPTVAPTTASSSSTTTSAAQAADGTVRAALAACVSRQDAAQPVVGAVATGSQHWSEHVQAETDLESGARSLIDVKTNTWGPTRAAGPGDVAAYDASVAGFATAPACQSPDPAVVALAPNPGAKLRACLAREQTLDAYLAAGAAVLQDWRTHLGEMADHADGHTNSAVAQADWIKRWREAPTHLVPYAAANAALAAAPPCTS